MGIKDRLKKEFGKKMLTIHRVDTEFCPSSQLSSIEFFRIKDESERYYIVLDIYKRTKLNGSIEYSYSSKLCVNSDNTTIGSKFIKYYPSFENEFDNIEDLIIEGKQNFKFIQDFVERTTYLFTNKPPKKSEVESIIDSKKSLVIKSEKQFLKIQKTLDNMEDLEYINIEDKSPEKYPFFLKIRSVYYDAPGVEFDFSY